ncbi:N-acetylmuramidase/lysin [uncultured Mediterranean phage uvMED]|nr:N-acetylmuramidase/lysin [uncultured Mediterranean phage uvMED]
MYALVEDGSVTKIITNPKTMVIGDVRYPAKIFQLWSKSELNAIGIYEVITNSSNFKDEKWYINTNESYAFADNQVTRSWGTATPKAHADSLYTSQDNTDGLIPDDKEVGDVKTRGLKYNLIQIIKQQASGLLAPTDWYVVKASEVSDYSVPTNIATYRASVRTKSNEMETAITNASDTPALETLYTYTEQDDGSVTRPLGELPTLEI